MFEIFRDQEVFLFGVLAYNAMYVDTITKIYGGAYMMHGVCQKIDETCRCSGLVSNDEWGDAGFLWNGICNCLCGWALVPLAWRPDFRQLFYIEGNLIGDCVTCIFCGNCQGCQERREYKLAVEAKGKDFVNVRKRKGEA